MAFIPFIANITNPAPNVIYRPRTANYILKMFKIQSIFSVPILTAKKSIVGVAPGILNEMHDHIG